MKLEYALSLDDYYEHQLYQASQSKVLKKRRRRNQLSVPVLYAGLAIWVYYKQQNWVNSGIFLFSGLLWYFFYPIYANWSAKRFYKKYIGERYVDQANIPVTIELTDTGITGNEEFIESKILNEEFDEVTELPNQYSLKMKNGQSLIIPKRAIDDVELFKEYLSGYGMTYLDRTDFEL